MLLLEWWFGVRVCHLFIKIESTEESIEELHPFYAHHHCLHVNLMMMMIMIVCTK